MKAGVDDGLVLHVHGVRQRDEVLLFGGVELVAVVQRDVGGRQRGDERFLHLHFLESSAEVVDVLAHSVLADVGDRAGAGVGDARAAGSTRRAGCSTVARRTSPSAPRTRHRTGACLAFLRGAQTSHPAASVLRAARQRSWRNWSCCARRRRRRPVQSTPGAGPRSRPTIEWHWRAPPDRSADAARVRRAVPPVAPDGAGCRSGW